MIIHSLFFIFKGTTNHNCKYNGNLLGCQPICLQRKRQLKCCKNHYGSDCRGKAVERVRIFGQERWVSELVDHLVSHSVSQWVSACPYEWVRGWMGEWLIDWLNEWVSGWVGEWVSEWVSECLFVMLIMLVISCRVTTLVFPRLVVEQWQIHTS